jgi:hypothetical protein
MGASPATSRIGGIRTPLDDVGPASQTQSEPGSGLAECVLEGRQIRPWPRQEIRILSIQRAERKIAALRRISLPMRTGQYAIDWLHRA